MSYERLKCQCCHEDFYAKTRKAKFCSNSCKQKEYRKRSEQKSEAKAAMLTFDEHAFVRAVCEVDEVMAERIVMAMEDGDLKFVKALYAVTRYPRRFQSILDAGLAELFPDIVHRDGGLSPLSLPF